MRTGRIALTILAVLWSVTSYAGPDATMQYLMNEPPSMLDLGILKMQLLLQKKSYVRNFFTVVTYNWNKDQIQVNVTDEIKTEAKKNTAKIAKLRCKKLIGLYRWALGMGPNGKPTIHGVPSWASGMFMHDGYKKHGQPKNLYQAIDRHIEIDAFVFYHVQHQQKTAECMGPFAGKSIYFKSH